MLDCVIGSCSEILTVVPIGCVPGDPSTYTLTLEVRHGGGGSSSNFDVVIDGQRHTQLWSTSPQTVVISGLIADGITGKTITIEADDNSDAGCAGSILFDSPTPDCSISILENFDNCSLPAGWTTASTNVFTWNGGDPLVQYEWKFDDATRQFANYDDGSNASSLLTIDGSCMALMDDDIINHPSYTGIVTMTTDFYDVSDVDRLQLSFDYNFHPFEDGKDQLNDSHFEVEVFNGVEWTQVLFDNDSDCLWTNVWDNGCNTTVELIVTEYINQNFAVRFIYSDGDDESWTGMIALDNIALSGTVLPSGPCENVITLVAPISETSYQAGNLITTSGSISISQNLQLSAPNVELEENFSVENNTTLTVDNDGCN